MLVITDISPYGYSDVDAELPSLTHVEMDIDVQTKVLTTTHVLSEDGVFIITPYRNIL